MSGPAANTEPGSQKLPVYLEIGQKRAFAVALDWPGWARAGKSEALALQALANYEPRYSPIADRAGLSLPPSAGNTFHVVERIQGSATTDFGALDRICAADRTEVTKAVAAELAALVRACWDYLDEVAATAPPVLRKGPRGGGRDRDAVVQHVLNSAAGDARRLGVRHPQPDLHDRPAVLALRRDIQVALENATSGQPPTEKGWPSRAVGRRLGWHVLDHAWEIEDRSVQ